MISFIRKRILGGSDKNAVAPHIFIILCAYTLITTAYTYIFTHVYSESGLLDALIRFGLCILILAVFVVIERSRLSKTLTAFLSPTLIAYILIFGAILFHGDSLIFIFVCAVAMISLTYFNVRGLMIYIIAVNAVLAVILTVQIISPDTVNLLGQSFAVVYNVIMFIAALGLSLLIYTFCGFCVRTLKDLTEAKNEANLAAQAKGSFLAKMSHEIRTPLNAVIGLTEVELRKKMSGIDAETLRKIHMSGNLLLGIINDILDMSKIESGKFDLVPEEYVFADLIYDTVTMNSVRIGQKPIKFSLSADESIPCRMLGDSLRIKQMLNNVLSNAFKYTHEGNVELRASWRPEGGGARLIFEVEDTGIGIRAEDIKNLFLEFMQVNAQNNRGVEGTGLGLSITKGLAELMRGKITARSEYGKGSVFTIDIRQEIVDGAPIGAAVAAALGDFTYLPKNEEPAVEYTPMPDANVLVVDDVEINLQVAACCLEPYGMRVDCVDNGAEAVRRVKEGEPLYDLIFMDQMMPGMDGIETARAIRRIGTKYAMAVPIVALTANALAGSDKVFMENGFQGFLAKPIELQKLDAILRKWILKQL